ncbi:MarR family transcriptional regulator [Actinocorallia sp. B10E7]|uniref:MarR family winged helix-turn-helix transcriptional regulator n=1 Tax=Actinocorallia sp. B10E7 TaxID=3153558 RepID=UPI00325DDB88
MASPRWLTPEEQAAWRAYLLSNQLLDEALDRQLQRDAGMPHAYYWILVALSEAPDHTLRMSDLARSLRYSQSRLTHAVTSMERRGWVRRDRCPSDGRSLLAALTPEGMRTLAESAPGHVEEVRSRVFDRLTPRQVAQLQEICQVILDGLDPA